MDTKLVLLLSLLGVVRGRPQEHQAVRARLVENFLPEVDCGSPLRRSLPECQRDAITYGQPGSVWGEFQVSLNVSSPVLFLTDPRDRIENSKSPSMSPLLSSSSQTP